MTQGAAHPIRRPGAWILLAALVLFPACTCRFTKTYADKQVYSLLDEKRPQVPELTGTLDIEAQRRLEIAARERKAYLLSADDAVGLAMISSREFRSEREDVYLTALSLTLERHDFDPIFEGGADAFLDVGEDGTSVAGGFGLGVRRALSTGGSIALGLANDFLRGLTGNPAEFAQSLISLDAILPILRGAGRLVALENLRQADRDTLYSMRSFARFQQELRVSVSSTVYNTLALQQRWQNEERAYESLLRLVDEQTLKGQAGKIPEFQVDQARQQLLQADDSRQRAKRVYQDALDDLKFELGIPMDVKVLLTREDLEAVSDGPKGPPMPMGEAQDVARGRRLDLKNAFGREQDARRKVLVARNALLAQLDFVASAGVDTPPNRPFDFDDVELRGDFGLVLELPLERMAERNVYVQSIVASMRAKRARERTEDQVDREVRTTYRRLIETQRSYDIQKVSVELAERRVESTGLLLQSGGATIRDRLEAEDARTDARNLLTNAIVDYAIAYLAYERDIGILDVFEPDAELPPAPPPGFPDPVEPAPDVIPDLDAAPDPAAATDAAGE